ncbi:hypothetical protein PVAP13_3KG228267 [Panicum virgatum]|uniref:Uncharacterized protein n=1 Tax=Panicum virgatum TaxID=38727 RepID=A0A8T0V144_PANVG|nr:hypothetical protein PVAP13_3KG228267 [Panicum virgatum]
METLLLCSESMLQKKRASVSSPVVEEQNQEQEHERVIEEVVGPTPTPPPSVEPVEDTTHKADWIQIHFMVGAFESFDFVFSLHLMFVILGCTNELSECLQRREQDIIHAIQLVGVAKNRMQHLRSEGWNQFLQKVTLFCNKHGVEVPTMEGNYVTFGRSRRFVQNQTNDDHFRREVYIGVIDKIS